MLTRSKPKKRKSTSRKPQFKKRKRFSRRRESKSNKRKRCRSVRFKQFRQKLKQKDIGNREVSRSNLRRAKLFRSVADFIVRAKANILLNGKSCRLRDIQDLFAGTGLSGAHYALIEQGKIGQILSSKPSDRRNLIEEAAGISKFRKRQRAAETRLESAKTNLSRISDIVSEIEKHANSLRRQASKTRRYKILREEFRELLRQTFSAEGRYLTEFGQ